MEASPPRSELGMAGLLGLEQPYVSHSLFSIRSAQVVVNHLPKPGGQTQASICEVSDNPTFSQAKTFRSLYLTARPFISNPLPFTEDDCVLSSLARSMTDIWQC